MRLSSCFRRSSSAPEAARLGLAGSLTHSARACLGFDALHFARMSCLFTLALEGQKLPVVTRMTLALDHFHHLSQYGIAVCKQCLCAVWPAQAYAHLTSKAHCLPKYEARSIANDLDSWQGLCSQKEFQLPILSLEYIPELGLYHDGLRRLLQQDDVPTQLCRVHGHSVPLVRRWLSS
jgi:hypothetical protein